MAYSLRFHALALSEWRKLDGSIREQLTKKLAEHLVEPRVPSALSGMPDCYKVKLRQAGYRLIYRVDDDVLYVTVLASGRRDKDQAYARAAGRMG